MADDYKKIEDNSYLYKNYITKLKKIDSAIFKGEGRKVEKKYDNLNIYNTLLVLSVFKSMSVQINYKTASSKKKSSNLVFFVDENFNITPLKKRATQAAIFPLESAAETKRQHYRLKIARKPSGNITV